MISIMEWLHVPSLERLVWSDEGDGFAKLLMDDICVSLVQLRHLTLQNMKLRRRRRVPASLWDHHISKSLPWNLSLMPMSCSSPYPAPAVAPALHVLTSKRLTISLDMPMRPDVLVDFIQQRVKSDLDDPAPGLVTLCFR